MRVIGGEKRGFKLACPPGMRVRPTPERVREAAFNILAPRIVGASVLDLMAGTGALGIEALSRGAKKAVFVDNHSQSIETIRRNLARCGLAHLGTVIKKDAFSFLKQGAGTLGPFDLIFIDPPYGWKKLPQLLRLISTSDFKPESLVVVEQAFGAEVPLAAGQLLQFQRRRYGNSELVLYRLKNKNI